MGTRLDLLPENQAFMMQQTKHESNSVIMRKQNYLTAEKNVLLSSELCIFSWLVVLQVFLFFKNRFTVWDNGIKKEKERTP